MIIHFLSKSCRPGTCDFENGDKCTWRNRDSGDDFDWIVGKGNTPSRWTGPGVDHTLSNGKGKFLLVLLANFDVKIKCYYKEE